MPKKLSSYEVEARIQKTRPYISIDHSTYKGTAYPCTFVDKEFGPWTSTPHSVLKGYGNRLRTKRNSYEIEKEIQKTRPHISIKHETYKSVKSKCVFVDSEYGEWTAIPYKVLIGHNNPKRSRFDIRKFEKEVQKTRPYISIDYSTFTNVNVPCTFIDEEFGPWDAFVYNVKKGGGHKKRFEYERKRSIENVEKQLREVHPNVKIVKEKYTKTNAKCTFIDPDYGEWEAFVYDVLSGKGHPIRAYEARFRNSYEIEKEIQKTRPHISIKHETYTMTGNKCVFVDSRHGEWVAAPKMVLSGSGHPAEHIGYKIESEISEWLKSLGVFFLLNDRKTIKPLEIDFYIPSLNVGIEYCGLYWHSEAKKPDVKHMHFKKLRACRDKGIKLLTIFEDEWLNRKEQVKDFIKHNLGLNCETVYARKCIVKEINSKGANLFYDKNHIQGKTKGFLHLGLFLKDRLIGCMTASLHHRNIKDFRKAAVLNRFAIESGLNVPGGASKLFCELKKRVSNSGFSRIISWSDNRWSEGLVYERLGFYLEKEMPPDYSYVKGSVRIMKQNMKKSNLLKMGASGDTELAMSRSLGFYRIWDCGKKRWAVSI